MTQFYTNGIARLTIDKDGNVGLFDNNLKLDVDGQIRMRGTLEQLDMFQFQMQMV